MITTGAFGGDPPATGAVPINLQPASFDLLGPLPTGTTVLEASAGTGKTHAIGALVVRFVAEGVVGLDRVLAVTFGRAASQELRERVRGHLIDAERALGDPAAARSGDEAVHRLLATGSDDEVALRRTRLRTALAEYDAATIVTIHQFCHHVLTGLGIAGDTTPDVELVEDLDDLVVEVVDDLYVRAFAGPTGTSPIFSRADAVALARAAVNDPRARLVPEPAASDAADPAARRVRFGDAVRAEVDRRKRSRHILGYDDLLGRLADSLAPADAAARDRMRDRWTVVLVDEFQDTDPVQWQIIERAFAGHATVVLVGDPKQSIYAFRGGDVTTYLAASAQAGSRRTLDHNWRSDGPVVRALQVLLDGVALGDPGIPVRPVTPGIPASRLVGAPSAAPVRLRQVSRKGLGAGRTGAIQIDKARDFVARDLAADVAALLESGATFDGRPVRAGDVAVIVGTHAQGALVREALAGKQIPSVEAGNQSVFRTSAGTDWLALLEAMEQPHRANRVRAAALTPFIGHTAADLDAGGEGVTDALTAKLSRWADVLAARGVAAVLEVAAAEERLPARLLALTGGERQLTDLRHVGQGLHAIALEEGLGVSALTEWLRRRCVEPDLTVSAERIRRLDVDAAAVQVVTLHASKGLQYPVVYLPFAFDRYVGQEKLLLLHQGGERVLDVGGSGTAGRDDRVEAAAAELAGEALRLLYVGLTRAQSQVVTWWAPTRNTNGSGLHRVLFGRRDITGMVPDVVELVDDEAATRRLASLEAAGGPVLEQAAIAAAAPVPVVPVSGAAFRVGVLDRSLEPAWGRMSYTSLSAAGGDQAAGAGAGVASEPELPERDDEMIGAAVDVAPLDAAAPESRRWTWQRRTPGRSTSRRWMSAHPTRRPCGRWASPMATLPAGTEFGTLVHAVLENTDPQAADLAAEVRRAAEEQLARRVTPISADELSEAILPVLRTSLGPLADGRSLASIPVRDRLAEMTFELPLGGGDLDPEGVTLADLAPLLRRHLPADDPMRPYADRLGSTEIGWQLLRGYLTGSLDAVLRLPGPRYLVADYKTNWLGDGTPGTLSAWHYRPSALDEVMGHSDYPMQALLYAVALHRFLRWRQPGYAPGEHIGGVLYLFVRGMVGPETPAVDGWPCGVFGWRPPPALIVELSDLLDAGDPARGRS